MSIINYCTTICATWLILNQQLLLIADACGQSSVSSIRFDQTQLNVSIGNKIIGGQTAQLGDWPWQALLYLTRGNAQLMCGGTIISEWWVVTAAHCIDDLTMADQSRSKIYLGIIDTNDADSNGYGIESYRVHNRYNPNMNGVSPNDIALIQLNRKISFNSRVQPICLPIDDRNLTKYSGYVTGWGKSTIGDSNDINQYGSQYLLQAVVPFIDLNTCGQRWLNLDGVSIGSDQLCAGAIHRGTGPGDSGGPLQVRDTNDDRWYLVGITSFGDNGDTGLLDQNAYPGVYTRVASFCDFINATTDGTVGCSSIKLDASSSNILLFFIIIVTGLLQKIRLL